MRQSKLHIDIGQSFVSRNTLLLACVAYLFMAGHAFAQDTPMGSVVCTVVDFVVYGNLGRGLATLSVIILGIGALLGKASWGIALLVGVGIAAIFGAPELVEIITDVSSIDPLANCTV